MTRTHNPHSYADNHADEVLSCSPGTVLFAFTIWFKVMEVLWFLISVSNRSSIFPRESEVLSFSEISQSFAYLYGLTSYFPFTWCFSILQHTTCWEFEDPLAPGYKLEMMRIVSVHPISCTFWLSFLASGVAIAKYIYILSSPLPLD